MKNKIVEIGKLLYTKDLTSATSGNISIKGDDCIYITATGTMLGLLNNNDVVKIDFNGNEMEEGTKASSEKYLHLKIYNERPDVNAIIHTHSPFTTAFAACRQELSTPIIAENILYFGKIPVADYAMPSSKELVENTVKYIKDYDTVLMSNHGIINVGSSVIDAFCKLETAETYAKTLIYAKILGTPSVLNEKQILDLEELRNKIKNNKNK